MTLALQDRRATLALQDQLVYKDSLEVREMLDLPVVRATQDL